MKKISWIIILVLVVVGFFYFLNKQQKDLILNVTDTTLSGVLVKNDWAKSLESYCAQGSEYFTLKTKSEELVLEYEPNYGEAQMSDLSGKNITVAGIKKQRKIECLEGQQCPRTPDGVFTCEVFKVSKINQSEN